MPQITASHLCAYLRCPHRVYRDGFDDPADKDTPNEFVQMLWEQGTQYERQIISSLRGETEVLDLSVVPVSERAAATRQALEDGVPLIYHGRLQVGGLLGEPDLLELLPDGEYLPIDIKSGMGLEGQDEESDGKYKKGYAAQLALYTDALRQLGFATHHRGAIWDSRGEVVEYDLTLARGKRTPESWWNFYEETLQSVRMLLDGRRQTTPALGSTCALCEWKRTCKARCVSSRCLSLVPELGRSKKEALVGFVDTIDALAAMDVADHLDEKGRTNIPGIGEKLLRKFQRRAKLLADPNATPIILEPIAFPTRPIELFFDIEADPTQDIVYLHGVIERRDGDPSTDRFHAFVARETTTAAEEQAWAEFWAYIRSLPSGSFTLYYYSKYERTQYRRLAERYPTVATLDEVEALFDPEVAVDLYYDVVYPNTEWPTYAKSVKELAQFCGFYWRDKNPSGAASIQWFNEYCREHDEDKLQRILDYNDDDCRAMIVVKEYLEALPNI